MPKQIAPTTYLVERAASGILKTNQLIFLKESAIPKRTMNSHLFCIVMRCFFKTTPDREGIFHTQVMR